MNDTCVARAGLAPWHLWLVGSLLYGVTTTDPLSFAAALLVLTMVGLLACYFPARRALRIDPVIARRHDGKNLRA